MSGLAVLITGATAMLPASEAHAIVVRDDVPLKTVNNRSNRPRYHSIGRLDTADPFLSGSLRGTATLVAPQWVLTAAHTLDGTSVARFTLGGQEYGVTGWTTPAGYQNDPTFYTDIALAKLDRPVVGVAPAQLRRTNASEVGRTAMILGYGYAGHGSTGQNHRTAQTLRLSTNRIDAVDDIGVLRTDFSIPGAPRAYELYDTGSEVTRFEGALTAGDSGAPAFIHDGTGFSLGAIGVYAADYFGGPLDGNYLEENGLLRVTPHLPWIDSVLNGGVSDAALHRSNTQTVQEDLDKLLADRPDANVVGWTNQHPTGATVRVASERPIAVNDAGGFPTGGTLSLDLIDEPVLFPTGATTVIDTSINPSGGFFIDYNPSSVNVDIAFPTAGQVEQGDLNLVLTDWGSNDDLVVAGDANLNGHVSQEELDAVLQNWGGSGFGDRVLLDDVDLSGGAVVAQGDLDQVLRSWDTLSASGVFNLDGTLDLSVLNFGAVPEPAAALTMLPLAGWCRRRHAS